MTKEEIEFPKTTGKWGTITHIGVPFGIYCISKSEEEIDEFLKEKKE